MLRKQNVQAVLLYSNRKMEFQMKIRKSINLQFVLPVQTYSQMFECVARCFSLKSKDGLKFLSLTVLSDYFVCR